MTILFTFRNTHCIFLINPLEFMCCSHSFTLLNSVKHKSKFWTILLKSPTLSINSHIYFWCILTAVLLSLLACKIMLLYLLHYYKNDSMINPDHTNIFFHFFFFLIIFSLRHTAPEYKSTCISVIFSYFFICFSSTFTFVLYPHLILFSFTRKLPRSFLRTWQAKTCYLSSTIIKCIWLYTEHYPNFNYCCYQDFSLVQKRFFLQAWETEMPRYMHAMKEHQVAKLKHLWRMISARVFWRTAQTTPRIPFLQMLTYTFYKTEPLNFVTIDHFFKYMLSKINTLFFINILGILKILFSTMFFILLHLR